MAGSNRLRCWLLASAAALGGAGLVASATFGDEQPRADALVLPPGVTESDFILCRTPLKTGPAASLFRLAATQTEVPATEVQAASPRRDFADTFRPLWG